FQIAEAVFGVPRRHVRGDELGADRLGPRERFLVGHQRHRRDTTTDVALRAALLQDRKHVVVVGVLRRDRLVRFTVLHRERDGGERGGGRQNGAQRLSADAHGCDGNADWMSFAASTNFAYASVICCLLPMSPKASSNQADRTSFVIAGSAILRFSGGSVSLC